jgi:uncharacterized C2H2 Zn-finger protein
MSSHSDQSCHKTWNDGVPQSANIGPYEPAGYVLIWEEDGTEQVLIRCAKCVQEFKDEEDFEWHYTSTHSKPESSRMLKLVALILLLDLLNRMYLVLSGYVGRKN